MAPDRPILGLRIGDPVSPVRDTKDLKFLLTQVQERRIVDADRITKDMVSTVGEEIPADFLITSGLIDFNWQQIYHQNGLSSVYLGTREQVFEPLSFEASEAIVAIRSDINNDQVRPRGTELSVVLNDSKGRPRIVNGQFASHSLLDIRRYVSISDTEEFEQPGYLNLSIEDLKLPSREIPTFPDRFFGGPFAFVNPLVSSKMGQMANGDTRTVCVYPSGRFLTRQYLKVSGEQFVTSTKGPGGERVVSAWSIDFPARLDPRQA